MLVKELIAELSELDPDKEVKVTIGTEKTTYIFIIKTPG
jgi:hypothetical protein